MNLQATNEDVEVFDPQLKEKFKEDKFYTWALYDKETGKYKGFIESTKYVVNHINTNGPFDGILGFSQGGFIGRLIIKSKEKRFEEYRPNVIPSFLILFSSGLMRNPFEELLTKYDVPILHIYGTNDKIQPKYDSSINVEGEKSIIVHDKGHTIPRFAGEKMDKFIEFIKQQYKIKFGIEMKFDKIVDEKYTNQINYKIYYCYLNSTFRIFIFIQYSKLFIFLLVSIYRKTLCPVLPLNDLDPFNFSWGTGQRVYRF